MKTASTVLLGLAVALGGVGAQKLSAGDLKITLPKRSHPTPVQRLNRDGVAAIRKKKYEDAKALFYKAYLYDPNDPFTLNNLGYVAELEGQVDRAEQFYALAAQQPTSAVIDLASLKNVQGESFRDELSSIHDLAMQINRANLHAVWLLSQQRATEADLLLTNTLKLEPQNPFTLNNMGVAKEMEGDYPQALKYYNAAAASQSKKPVIMTVDNSWRGKPVSEMADESSRRLQHLMKTTQTPEDQANLFNLRGVSAVNRNDWKEAEKDFRQAYKLNPNSAFSVNNLAYVSEKNGDLETAQYLYEKAQSLQQAQTKVGLATRSVAEGKPLFEVADQSSNQVQTGITTEQEARRKQNRPILLQRRDGSTVPESAPAPSTPAPVPNQH
jgi:Flp pilus assembly protein TadD